MKNSQAFLVILAILVLGFVAYSYYSPQEEHQSGEMGDFSSQQADMNNLDAETELEAEITSQESQEVQTEEEFNELESMNF